MNNLDNLLALPRVSVHGGHSGQFCNHARDSLEEVILAYIAEGFSWVGITEHLPPSSDAMRYPDEIEDCLSARFLQQRFIEYFDLCRSLRDKYSRQIEIFTAFETETYAGSEGYIREWMAQVKPDYLVGSVHHVDGLGIDISQELFNKAMQKTGSMENLYCGYFDAQYEMLESLLPSVVGHFDLIRKFDDNYIDTLSSREVMGRIERNLQFIADKQLIMDFNLRGFDKSQEQYPCQKILKMAVELNIALVPGDDSHGVASVGRHYDKGLGILAEAGITGPWQKPKIIVY